METKALAERIYDVLLVDDRQEQLNMLVDEITDMLPTDKFAVVPWSLNMLKTAGDPLDALEGLVSDRTLLVATDYDLTASVRGFFGSAIVNWCQARFIPVCNFSKGNRLEAFTEPGLFDIVVDPGTAASRIAEIAQGFAATYDALAEQPEISNYDSPAAGLVAVLGPPANEADLAPYFARLGTASRSLLNELRKEAYTPGTPTNERRVRLTAYVLGHVMLNGILAYPGPIFSTEALAAYCATSVELEGSELETLFEVSRYRGPFSESNHFYWRALVDDQLDAVEVDEPLGGETFDQNNRRKVEIMLGRPLGNHTCDRDGCHGTRGGFLCPFTRRPVCQRADCSVSATGWIPGGADSSRIEKEFYDEWAPLLGY